MTKPINPKIAGAVAAAVAAGVVIEGTHVAGDNTPEQHSQAMPPPNSSHNDPRGPGRPLPKIWQDVTTTTSAAYTTAVFAFDPEKLGLEIPPKKR